MSKRAMEYTEDNPLFVVAIGAITNIASAILINPEIVKNIVIIWLGGHAHHFCCTNEFNMRQDFAASRVVMNSEAPFVQLPCEGVVSSFTISKPELEYWFSRRRPIWDVTAVAWLLNDNDCFMQSRITRLNYLHMMCIISMNPPRSCKGMFTTFIVIILWRT